MNEFTYIIDTNVSKPELMLIHPKTQLNYPMINILIIPCSKKRKNKCTFKLKYVHTDMYMYTNA